MPIAYSKAMSIVCERWDALMLRFAQTMRENFFGWEKSLQKKKLFGLSQKVFDPLLYQLSYLAVSGLAANAVRSTKGRC